MFWSNGWKETAMYVVLAVAAAVALGGCGGTTDNLDAASGIYTTYEGY